jgi:hypothetical protein
MQGDLSTVDESLSVEIKEYYDKSYTWSKHNATQWHHVLKLFPCFSVLIRMSHMEQHVWWYAKTRKNRQPSENSRRTSTSAYYWWIRGIRWTYLIPQTRSNTFVIDLRFKRSCDSVVSIVRMIWWSILNRWKNARWPFYSRWKPINRDQRILW